MSGNSQLRRSPRSIAVLYGGMVARLPCVLLLAPLLFFLPSATSQLGPEPATVRIGILSLFHPRVLVLGADHPLTLLLDGSPRILDSRQTALLRATAAGFDLELPSQPPIRLASLAVTPGTFTLAVPGKLTRAYRGELEVSAHAGMLVPVVVMETELAVASIVAAEAPPGAPLEALKAQAIVSRSFLLGNHGTHSGYDACDTTHCQYLRSPPADGSKAAVAAEATRHLVLSWRSSADDPVRIVAAMYSRSCGGHTRALQAASSGAYPFYSVRCEYCLRHPERWTRPAPTTAPRSEAARIAWNRTHGWSAIPSGSYVLSSTTVTGRGVGHGVGLCQLGASDLASHSETFVQILRHYFPNATLSQLP